MDLGAIPVGMIANHTALQMLLLHAASAGRGALLFGESLERIRKALPDFVNPVDLQHFPDLYLEFPLLGEPFLDVTVLYSETPESMRIASPLAAGTEQSNYEIIMLPNDSWFLLVNGLYCAFDV